MEIRAVSKSVRVSPRKVRLVAQVITNQKADDALRTLYLLKKRGSLVLEKTLKSAIANATNNANLKREDLVIKSLDVLEAPAYKRYHPSTRGRIHPYKKRGSHITIVLEDLKVEAPKEEVKKEIKEEKKEEEAK